MMIKKFIIISHEFDRKMNWKGESRRGKGKDILSVQSFRIMEYRYKIWKFACSLLINSV